MGFRFLPGIFVAVVIAGSGATAAPLTFELDLRFLGDETELQSGYGSGDVCRAGEPCYPADFRLVDGYFADLEVGQRTTASLIADLDTTAGSGSIGSWTSVPPEVYGHPPSAALPDRLDFVDTSDALTVDLANRTLFYEGEGPSGFSYSGCNPADPTPGLPDGFCGFYGYLAKFDILGYRVLDENGHVLAEVAPVPLPAGIALLPLGLGALVLTRRRRRKA